MNNHAGCCCRVHTGSFGGHKYGEHQPPDEALIERALRFAGHAQTEESPAPIVTCDGSMICICAHCEHDRRAKRRQPARQPWSPRKARTA